MPIWSDRHDSLTTNRFLYEGSRIYWTLLQKYVSSLKKYDMFLYILDWQHQKFIFTTLLFFQHVDEIPDNRTVWITGRVGNKNQKKDVKFTKWEYVLGK